MRGFMFVLCCFAIVFFFSPRQSSAQCRGSACGPAVVQFWAPSGHVAAAIAERPILGAPVRIAERTVVAVRTREFRPVAHVLAWRPFRGGCR